MTATRHRERAPLIRKSAWMVGGLVLVGATAVLGYAVLVAHHSAFQGDAVAYRLIARDPFSNGAPLRFGAHTTGVAYRYGRVGYPLAAWVLALGVPRWVGWTLGVVTIIGAAAIGLTAAECCARRGKPAWHGVAVFLAPVMTISLAILYAEPLVIALVLVTYLLWLDDRHAAAAISAAGLLLVREAAAAALLPLLYVSLRRRNRRDLALLIGAFGTYAAWTVWVRLRVGQFPFLDPASSRRDSVGLPLVGYLRGPFLGLLLVAAVTLGVAVWLHLRRPWFPFTQGAIILSLFNLCLQRGVLMYRGDALRVMGPSQALALLCLAAFAGVGSRPQPDPTSTTEREGSHDSGSDLAGPAVDACHETTPSASK